MRGMACFMKKCDLHNIKNIIRYMVGVASVVTACYGFWGYLFPDLTLVDGTYRIISGEENMEDADQLYNDILAGKVTVTYRSKLWEMIKSRCGLEHER